MCIRDSRLAEQECVGGVGAAPISQGRIRNDNRRPLAEREACLLYTSDAADERSSVDLGGRRIIKKKKQRVHKK